MSGPIAAGAEEPEASPLGEFAESEGYLLGLSNWLNLEAADAPATAESGADVLEDTFTEGPTIVSNIELRGCSTEPELSVTYTVTASDDLGSVWLGGSVGDDWSSRSIDIEPGDKTVTFTETRDLSPLNVGEFPGGFVRILVEAIEPSGRSVQEITDLEIELDRCTYSDSVVEDGPEVKTRSLELSECSSSPKLSATFDIRDSNGIQQAWLSSDLSAERFDTEAGATAVTVSGVVDVSDLAERDESEINVSVEAYGSDAGFGMVYLRLFLDFDSCTWRIYDGPVDEDLEIELVSAVVSECATSPKMAVTYMIRDDDGILSVDFFSTLERTEVVDIEMGAKEVSFTRVLDVMPLQFEDEEYPEVILVVDVFDAFADFSSRYESLILDLDLCTATPYDDFYGDGDDSDSDSDSDSDEIVVTIWNGPKARLEDYTVDNCATAPEVSFTYSVSAVAGIARVNLFNSFTSESIKVPVSGETQISGNASFVFPAGFSSEDAYYFQIEVYDTNGNGHMGNQPLNVDLDTCSIEWDDEFWGKKSES